MKLCREPNDQPWQLCEPISFLDIDGYELYGCSKLNVEFDSLGPDDSRSPTTGKTDLQFLVELLIDISEKYGIDWEIGVMGQQMGEIKSGICDPEITEGIEMIANAGAIGPPDGFPEFGNDLDDDNPWK